VSRFLTTRKDYNQAIQCRSRWMFWKIHDSRQIWDRSKYTN